MALVPYFKELTDNILEFLRGLTNIEKNVAIRAHPWMYMFGMPDTYFPGFFVVPPSIGTVQHPIYGTVLQINYSIYYVMRMDEETLSTDNPLQEMEDITSRFVEKFEEDPYMGLREFVDAGEYSCSIENEMTFWARDLSQPYIALKIELTFTARMQR